MDEVRPPEPSLALDANADGSFTISDALPWLAQVYFLPGDWLIWLAVTRAPFLADFLEVSTGDYGGLLSGFLSGSVWLAGFIGVLVVGHSVRVIDAMLTTRVRNSYDFLLRRIRVMTQLMKHRLTERRARRQVEQIEFSEEPDLDAAELRALAAYAGVEPPYALGVSEVAAQVRSSKRETEAVLEKLTKLGLLKRATGTADGEHAYLLSPPGRAWLAFRRLTR